MKDLMLNVTVNKSNLDQILQQLQKYKQELEKNNIITIEEWLISKDNEVDEIILNSIKMLACNIYREKHKKDPSKVEFRNKHTFAFPIIEQDIISQAYDIIKKRNYICTHGKQKQTTK